MEKEEIKGEKYKFAGVEVYQKGTLVQVFAKFAKIEDNYEDLLVTKCTTEEEKQAVKGGMFEGMYDDPSTLLEQLPCLSVDDIMGYLVGKEELATRRASVDLNHENEVKSDLGPEKMARILVKMGEARKQVLSEGHRTFVHNLPSKSKAPKA